MVFVVRLIFQNVNSSIFDEIRIFRLLHGFVSKSLKCTGGSVQERFILDLVSSDDYSHKFDLFFESAMFFARNLNDPRSWRKILHVG